MTFSLVYCRILLNGSLGQFVPSRQLSTSAICSRHWESRSYQWSETDRVSDRERLDSVSSFYTQSAVDVAAAKQEVYLTPERLLYTGAHPSKYHILRSAQFIYQELPVRIAHRIMRFRTLPFIVGCNPILLSVHNIYLEAFRKLTKEPPVENFDDEARFSTMLRHLLDDHSHIISMLAEGFKECRHRIKDPELVTKFLDQTLTSRLSTRLIVEHHLKLHEETPDQVGIIDKRMSLTAVVQRQVRMVSEMCRLQYGVAPKVIVAGQTNLVFPYIRMPLEYILTELLKNAFRATIESRLRLPTSIPPIHITLSSDGTDFWIRISDHAGGIPAGLEDAIWEYHVSTPSALKVNAGWESAIGENEPSRMPDTLPPPTAASGTLNEHIVLCDQAEENIELPPQHTPTSNAVDNQLFTELTQHKVAQSIHGFGFGLPISRAYARHFGGDLQLYTMRSIGTDCYLRLRHIDGKAASFRI